MGRARGTRVSSRRAAGFCAALILLANLACAAMPVPETVAADIDSGQFDAARFDFAAAGYWDLPPNDRQMWFARVSTSAGDSAGNVGRMRMRSRFSRQRRIGSS